jgi:hypothetical protein
MLISTLEGRLALLKAMGIQTGRIKSATIRVDRDGIDLEVHYFMPDEDVARVSEEVKHYQLVDTPVGFVEKD